jgi:hypothetical protein
LQEGDRRTAMSWLVIVSGASAVSALALMIAAHIFKRP